MLKLGILMTSVFSATWWVSASGDWWHLIVRSIWAIGISYAIFVALMLLAEQRRMRTRRFAHRTIPHSMTVDGLIRFHRDNDTKR